MTREYTFPDYGIERPVSLLGCVTPLLPGRGVPVVFLIDENHGIDECIEQNIVNARALVQTAGVTLVGVESHRGGFEWFEGKYSSRFDPGTNRMPVNRCPKFAEEMLKTHPGIVFGVECLGMSDEQECNCAVNDNPYFGKPIKDHPLDAARSQHFIYTLFEMQTRHGRGGNLILNAGGDHNSHIEQWIKDGSIEARARRKAAYVRVRAPAYRD